MGGICNARVDLGQPTRRYADYSPVAMPSNTQTHRNERKKTPLKSFVEFSWKRALWSRIVQFRDREREASSRGGMEVNLNVRLEAVEL